LVADMPDLTAHGPIASDTHRWLERAAALIRESGDRVNVDHVSFTIAVDGLVGVLRERYAHQIVAVLHRALARAELKAPASAQGAFIPVGAAFDVFQTIGKVLREAKQDVFIVDPYMDDRVLTDFAPLTADAVAVRLLTDIFYTKPAALQPAAQRWTQQYAGTRPLEVRLTAARLLHDRLIIVDGAKVWSLTKPLKDFAARSPATILRVEGDFVRLKIDAYEQMWTAAQPLP
jgi:hypothetical protein